MAKKKAGKQKQGSEFFKRYEGALDSGYSKDEAAAIAHGGSNVKESRQVGIMENIRSIINSRPK